MEGGGIESSKLEARRELARSLATAIIEVFSVYFLRENSSLASQDSFDTLCELKLL